MKATTIKRQTAAAKDRASRPRPSRIEDQGSRPRPWDHRARAGAGDNPRRPGAGDEAQALGREGRPARPLDRSTAPAQSSTWGSRPARIERGPSTWGLHALGFNLGPDDPRGRFAQGLGHFSMVTREAIQEMAEMLTDEGLLFINVCVACGAAFRTPDKDAGACSLCERNHK